MRDKLIKSLIVILPLFIIVGVLLNWVFLTFFNSNFIAMKFSPLFGSSILINILLFNLSKEYDIFKEHQYFCILNIIISIICFLDRFDKICLIHEDNIIYCLIIVSGLCIRFSFLFWKRMKLDKKKVGY